MSIQYGILHLRKTAGTALKAVIDRHLEMTACQEIAFFGHDMTLSRFISEYPSAQAIFIIRDPISRFVSGFYSRLRQGRPRYDYPWRSGEAKAFARFQTPNQLAEALSGYRFGIRRHAIAAMNSIGHVKHTYLDSLGMPDFLERIKDRIVFIGHQTHFDIDLDRLRKILKIDASITAPHDDISAHRNPHDLDKNLSEEAIANLREWYAPDISIYQWCLMRREHLIQQMNDPFFKKTKQIIEECS